MVKPRYSTYHWASRSGSGDAIAVCSMPLTILSSFQYVFVMSFVLRNDFVGTEPLRCIPAAGLAHTIMQIFIREQRHYAGGLPRDIAHSFQESVLSIGDQFRHAADARCYRHYAASHRFQRHQAESLEITRHQEHMRQWNQALHVILLAQKGNVAVYFERARQMFGGAAFRPISDHEQVRGNRLPYFGQDANAIEHTLYGPEIRKE